MENDLELTNLLFQLKTFADSLALQLLVKKYQPMILSLIGHFHLQLLDTDDLLQEARIICYQTACSFDPTKANITFGAYFKLSLCNHFRSLLRRENAQKRLLEKQVISLEELLYEKGDILPMTLGDFELRIELELLLQKLPTLLTPLEYRVFCAYLHYQKASLVAQKLELSQSQINNAMQRYHHKLARWYQKKWLALYFR